MNPTLKVSLFACVMIHSVSALNLNHYYTSNGGFGNTCESEPCPACSTGQYRSGCGNSGGTVPDAQKGSSGTCESCTLKPANSSYASYPAGGTFSDAACPFTCDSGYTLSANGLSCVATSCPVPALNTNIELVPGASPTNTIACETRCKAGYSGNTASNPSTCTICGAGTLAAAGSVSCAACTAGKFQGLQGQSSCTDCTKGSYSSAGATQCTPCAAGTSAGLDGQSSCSACNAGSFSAAGAFACSPCATGSYSSSSGVSQCTPCPAGTHGPSTGLTACPDCDPVLGVPQYTTTQGNAVCTPCVTCTTTGQWRSGCGRDSAGACISCSN